MFGPWVWESGIPDQAGLRERLSTFADFLGRFGTHQSTSEENWNGSHGLSFPGLSGRDPQLRL